MMAATPNRTGGAGMDAPPQLGWAGTLVILNRRRESGLPLWFGRFNLSRR